MKKLVFKSILYFTVLCGAGYGYVWFTAKTSLDKVMGEHQDDLNFNYSQLVISPFGSVVLSDIRVQPYLLRRSYDVDEIRLDFGSLPALLTAMEDLKVGLLPQKGYVALTGISSELEGRDPEQVVSKFYGPNLVKPFALYGCGAVDRVGHEQLQEMGINRLNMDITLDFEFDVAPSDLVAAITIDAGDLSYVSFETAWEGIKRDSQVSKPNIEGESTTMSIDAKLKHLNISHRDSGYFRRLGFYCSKLKAVDRERFAVLAAIAWRNMFNEELKVRVSDELASAYALYLRDGGSLNIEIDPPVAINLASLTERPETNLIETMGVTIEVNGDIVSGGSLIYTQPVVKQPKVVEVAKVLETQKKASYKPTEFEQLEGYIGNPLRISLLSGKVQEGILERVGKFGLEMSKHVSGGKVKYQYGKKDIDTIEVWRK